jgi:hypothetical protein
MAVNTTAEINYVFGLALPAAHASEVTKLQTNNTTIPALGASLGSAALSTWTRQQIIDSVYWGWQTFGH